MSEFTDFLVLPLFSWDYSFLVWVVLNARPRAEFPSYSMWMMFLNQHLRHQFQMKHLCDLRYLFGLDVKQCWYEAFPQRYHTIILISLTCEISKFVACVTCLRAEAYVLLKTYDWGIRLNFGFNRYICFKCYICSEYANKCKLIFLQTKCFPLILNDYSSSQS